MYLNDLPRTEDIPDSSKKLVASQTETSTVPNEINGTEGPEDESNGSSYCFGGEQPAEINSKWRQNQKRRTYEELVDIVQKNLCSPIEKVVYTPTWTSDKKLLCLSDNILEKVFFKVKSNILRMSIKEIYNLCMEANYVYFGSYLSNLINYYLGIDESIDIVEDLLNFQFNCVFHAKINFLTDLYLILDKQHQKFNCLQIVGPLLVLNPILLRVLEVL